MTAGRPEAPQASRWESFWQPFWVLPAVIAACSVALGLLLPLTEDVVGSPLPWLFRGGSSGARTVLSTVAGAMISVTGLVFSITVVVLQLASSQFTPRVVGTFLDSRVTQVTLGVFTGSFLYSLSVLRSVRGAEDVPAPQTAVAIAYLYVVVAVVMFLWFIHHMTQSLQVSQMMTRVRRLSLGTVDRLHAEDDAGKDAWSPRPGTPRSPIGMDDRTGYVTVLASTELVQAAADLGVVVALDLSPGDHVVPGQPLGTAWGRDDLGPDELAPVLATLTLRDERNHLNDRGFGVRQLIDIAERALSPGINDPTTAVQAMDELHVILRRMVSIPDPSAYLRDEDGEVRAVYRPQTYGDLLRMSLDELVQYGSDSVRVIPRLRAMLSDLERAATPAHAATTTACRERLDLDAGPSREA